MNPNEKKGTNVKLKGIDEKANHNLFIFQFVIVNNVVAYNAHMEPCMKRIK